MHIIVGVDAGINVGYAALDLNGKLIDSGCVRDANEETIVRIISGLGIPSIIASDVCPPSHFVSKISARFNVKLFHPKKSMKTKEKREIAIVSDLPDPHMRDAYAAAIKAYRKYANRLRQIDKLEKDDIEKDLLKNAVIMGNALTKVIKRNNGIN